MLLAGLGGMLAAGLLRLARRPHPCAARSSRRLAAPCAGSPSRGCASAISGRALPVTMPLLGWLFTPRRRLGAAGAARRRGLGLERARGGACRAIRRASPTSTLQDALLGYLIFVGAKLLHESAMRWRPRRMAAAEGHAAAACCPGASPSCSCCPRPMWMPPAAWFLASPRRRAAVGLAGVATDLLVAGAGGAGLGRAGAGRAGRPAVRPGADLLGLLAAVQPQPAGQARRLLRAVRPARGREPAGARAGGTRRGCSSGRSGWRRRRRRADVPARPRPLASWVYRWTIYLGIFWLAGRGALAAGGSGRGRWSRCCSSAAAAARGAHGAAAGRRRRVSRCSAAAGAGTARRRWRSLPLPAWVTAQGVVLQDGLALVYARTDARVTAVAPPGAARGRRRSGSTTPIPRACLPNSSPEAAAPGDRGAPARADGPRHRRGGGTRRAVAGQIERAEARAGAAGWSRRRPAAAVGAAARRWRCTGAWVRRDDARPLGALMHRRAGGDPPRPRPVGRPGRARGPRRGASEAGRSRCACADRARGAASPRLPVAPPVEARDTLPSAALAPAAGGPHPGAARCPGRGAAGRARLRTAPDARRPDRPCRACATARASRRWIALPPARRCSPSRPGGGCGRRCSAGLLYRMRHAAVSGGRCAPPLLPALADPPRPGRRGAGGEAVVRGPTRPQRLATLSPQSDGVVREMLAAEGDRCAPATCCCASIDDVQAARIGLARVPPRRMASCARPRSSIRGAGGADPHPAGGCAAARPPNGRCARRAPASMSPRPPPTAPRNAAGRAAAPRPRTRQRSSSWSIRAPFDGVVTRLDTVPGATLLRDRPPGDGGRPRACWRRCCTCPRRPGGAALGADLPAAALRAGRRRGAGAAAPHGPGDGCRLGPLPRGLRHRQPGWRDAGGARGGARPRLRSRHERAGADAPRRRRPWMRWRPGWRSCAPGGAIRAGPQDCWTWRGRSRWPRPARCWPAGGDSEVRAARCLRPRDPGRAGASWPPRRRGRRWPTWTAAAGQRSAAAVLPPRRSGRTGRWCFAVAARPGRPARRRRAPGAVPWCSRSPPPRRWTWR